MRKYYEKHGHRGISVVYYTMNFDYYWPGIRIMLQKFQRSALNVENRLK